MNIDALLALIRREVIRGRRLLVMLTAVTGAAFLLTLVGGEAISVIAVSLAGVSAFLSLLGPSGDLAGDKLLGHLEADQVLPVSSRLVAAGRLLGASVRLLPVVIAALAIAVVVWRELEAGPLGMLLLVVIPLVSLLLASLVSWTLLALNARWQFRNLWWLPITLVMGPQILTSALPTPVKAAIARWVASSARGLAAFAVTPGGLVVSFLTITLLPAIVFAGATLLYASGLERYRYDANALGTMLGKAPKRELGAIGKGPLLAVARLRIRLSLEQQRRNGIFLLILLVVLLIGSEELQDFARIYVRVVAVMLPAGIAMQLTAARSTGYLEGMQQLPHSARTVALGHLAAIAVMAVPGAVVLLLGRLAAGRTPGFVEGLSIWSWFVVGGWIAAVLAVWLKLRYLAMMAGAVTLMLLAWYAIVGGEGMAVQIGATINGFQSIRLSAGAALPVAMAMLVAMAGVPLFAKGVETYQFRGKGE